MLQTTNQQDADLQGMNDAEFRHSGAMLPAEIAEQYNQLCQVDYSKPSPAQVPADPTGTVDFRRMGIGVAALGGVGAGVYVVANTVAAVVAAVHAFCAANILLVGGGAVGLSALLLFFAGRSGGGESKDGGGQKNITIVTTYNINQK